MQPCTFLYSTNVWQMYNIAWRALILYMHMLHGKWAELQYCGEIISTYQWLLAKVPADDKWAKTLTFCPTHMHAVAHMKSE